MQLSRHCLVWWFQTGEEEGGAIVSRHKGDCCYNNIIPVEIVEWIRSPEEDIIN